LTNFTEEADFSNIWQKYALQSSMLTS